MMMCHRYSCFFDISVSRVLGRKKAGSSTFYGYEKSFWLCLTNKINWKNDKIRDKWRLNTIDIVIFDRLNIPAIHRWT